MMTTLIYGLYTAGASIVVTLLVHFLGLEGQPLGTALSFLTWPLIGLFVWLATKERRDEEWNGGLQYGQGVVTGLLVGLWAGLVFAVFLYFFWTFISPDFIDKAVEQARARMLEQSRSSGGTQLSSQQIETSLEMMRRYFVPFGLGGAVLGDIAVATLISLGTSAFLKRDLPEIAPDGNPVM